MDAIFKRTSTRKFTEQDVEPEKLQKLLEAAMQAPTAVNQQNWEFFVVKDPEKLLALSQVTPYSMCVKNAKTAIVIAYNKTGTMPVFNQVDAAIAVENIWLEATELGLGTVMIGVAPVKEWMDGVAAVIDLPDSMEAFTIMPIGYPAREKEQEPRFNPDKVHYIE